MDRERLAKRLFDSGAEDRGPEYGAVRRKDIKGRHRDGWLRLADVAIDSLAIPPAAPAPGESVIEAARSIVQNAIPTSAIGVGWSVVDCALVARLGREIAAYDSSPTGRGEDGTGEGE